MDDSGSRPNQHQLNQSIQDRSYDEQGPLVTCEAYGAMGLGLGSRFEFK